MALRSEAYVAREPSAAELGDAFGAMAAAARAHAAAVVPGLVAAAATASDLGRAAELAAAAALGAVPWALLPLPLRRRIHGHGDPRDRGVDAVGWTPAGLWLVQVKWLRAPGLADDGAPTRFVGHDPVARLTNIRGACERAGLAVARCSIAAPPGVAVAAGVPGADVVDVVTLADIGVPTPDAAPDAGPDAAPGIAPDLGAKPAPGDAPPVGPAPEAVDPVPEDDPERYGTEAHRAHCAEAVAALWALAAAGRGEIRAEMPPGVGKSYVIRGLVERGRAAGWRDVLVVAPRVEIVRQLAATLRGLNSVAVAEGGDFPPGAWRGDGAGAAELDAAPVVVVLSAQSARRLPAGRWAAVFYDEAHHMTGRGEAEARAARGVTFLLSASLPAADYRLTQAAAVARGLVADARLVFAAFEAAPTFADLAAFVATRYEFGSVLACCQTQGAARDLCGEFARRGVVARTYTSADGDSDALAAFRAGAVRVLCVVTRLEMGVNVHRCDTVLLAEPWGSLPRLRQLCGRAARLHPAKMRGLAPAPAPADGAAGAPDIVPQLYSVVVGVAREAGPADVARLVDALHAELDLAPAAAWLAANVEVVGGRGALAGDAAAAAVEAVGAMVLDSFGRRLSPLEALRRVYEAERARLAPLGWTHLDFAVRHGELGLAPDPAARFAELGPFRWRHYLSAPAPDADALLRAAWRVALDNGARRNEVEYADLVDAYPMLPVAIGDLGHVGDLIDYS